MKKALTCAVIGAGVTGASAAYALARCGVDVTLFEQFDLFHEKGSSHGATRAFRTAYFEHPDYVPVLQQAEKGWRDLEDDCGDQLLIQSGVMMAGPKTSAAINGARKSAEMHNLDLVELSSQQFESQFPWLTQRDIDQAVIERTGGVIFANKALKAFIGMAKNHNAKIVDNTQINLWRSSDAGVTLLVEDEPHRFDRLVIAPGAFAHHLLGDIGVPVTPKQKTLFWVTAQGAQYSLAGNFLPFFIETRDRRMFYGFPAVDSDGIKIAEHTGGRDLANALESSSDQTRLDKTRLERFLKNHAPHLPQQITREQSCLYAMSTDGDFIIDHHPEDTRVVFAAGLSGHGFKFAPALGEALADLAIKGETRREFKFLALNRFAR